MTSKQYVYCIFMMFIQALCSKYTKLTPKSFYIVNKLQLWSHSRTKSYILNFAINIVICRIDQIYMTDFFSMYEHTENYCDQDRTISKTFGWNFVVTFMNSTGFMGYGHQGLIPIICDPLICPSPPPQH